MKEPSIPSAPARAPERSDPMSEAFASIRRRLAQEESGFTLLELLIVTITMGILLSIAAPAYLQFKDRGSKAAAAANLRQVAQSLAAYANENFANAPVANDPDWNGSDAPGTGTNADSGYHDGFAGMTMWQLLQSKYNPSIPQFTINNGFIATPNDSADYCIYLTVGPWYAAARAGDPTTSVGKLMNLSTCSAT
jgi:prepilin-type N-terminal cleavage/methylation domain-containing protein